MPPSLPEIMVAYGSMCDPVECKLASLLQQRNVRQPYERLIPFALNMFTTDVEYRNAYYQDILEYIWVLHSNYAQELDAYCVGKQNRFDLTEHYGYQASTPHPHTFDHIDRSYGLLAQIDGITGPFHLADFSGLQESDFRLSKACRLQLDEALSWASEVYWTLYNPMCAVYSSHQREIVGNPNQVTIEVMEFLSHLGTAFCALARKAKANRMIKYEAEQEAGTCAFRNIDSAIRHLRMGCLDMMKSVQASILANELTETDDLRQILQVRHVYCIRKYGDAKLGAYREVTRRLFEKFLLQEALNIGAIVSWDAGSVEVPR